MVLDGKHCVTQVCKMMHVSQSALNRWRRQFLAEQQGITPKAPAISAEQREIQRLRAENEQLRSEETYGSRRLSQTVTDLGINVGRFKVRRLMREMAIKAKCPKAKVWRKQAVSGRFCGKSCK